MPSDATWRAIRERCDAIGRDDVLVTPGDERVFAVTRTGSDRLVVQFREGGERTLWREQFGVLADRIDDEGLALDSLPPGVGPYAAVLTLAPAVTVEDGRLVRADDESTTDAGSPSASTPTPSTSPFVRSRWDVRRPPEAVHDDALLVADFLERHDATALEDLPPGDLTDLYVLLSDVQRGADELRRDVGEDLLDHVGPEGRLHGQYGTVSRTRRERRQMKGDDVVLDALDDAGVPGEWVLGVDESKLDVVLAATDVEVADVYDVHEQYYVQKTGVESEAKRSRLQGLKDRLAELDGREGEELREEIETLENRIDDVLAAG